VTKSWLSLPAHHRRRSSAEQAAPSDPGRVGRFFVCLRFKPLARHFAGLRIPSAPMACEHKWKPEDGPLSTYTVGAIWECTDCGTEWRITDAGNGNKKLVEID
jgi:hypothetical protein